MSLVAVANILFNVAQYLSLNVLPQSSSNQPYLLVVGFYEPRLHTGKE